MNRLAELDEVPRARRVDGRPVNADVKAVAGVIGDHPDGLDVHSPDGMLRRVGERQVAFLGKNGLDCDAVTGPHCLYFVQISVIVAVFPDALAQETVGLVIRSAVGGADEPAGAVGGGWRC